MAISPKMLAVLRKVDAARAEFFAGLRESAKQEAQVRVERKKQLTNARKKPPAKVAPLRMDATPDAPEARRERKGPTRKRRK
ncbi:MAG TPA: hypothetical protein VLK35_04925 [Methylomirabilota bacterium]|nr:hypothetical protein [Methylomirabilota bacterium]